MIIKYLHIIFLLSLIALTGCYTDFEPDLKSTPVVCINSLITAGDSIQVEVTRTWRYSEGDPLVKLDVTLKDAEVSLYVNDRFEEQLVYTARLNYYYDYDYFFAAKYIPKPGDRIMILAIDKTYGEAEAEVTVPHPVEIDKVEARVTSNRTSYDEINDTFHSDFEMTLNVTLTDPVNETNAYIFEMPWHRSIVTDIEYEDGYTGQAYVESASLFPDYSYEPIFSEHISPIETVISNDLGIFSLFSDRQFSGKPYTLRIPINGDYHCNYRVNPEHKHELTMEIQLAHISTAYYNYMISWWAANEGVHGILGDVGLGDPVFEHSNVSTGAGIVAARAISTAHLNIYNLLSE